MSRIMVQDGLAGVLWKWTTDKVCLKANDGRAITRQVRQTIFYKQYQDEGYFSFAASRRKKLYAAKKRA